MTGTGLVRWRAGLMTVALLWAGASPAPAAEAAAPSEDLTWVPAGGTGFVTAHVAALWQTEQIKGLRKALTKGDPRALQEAEAKMGLEFEQVERLTVVLPDPAKEDVAVLLVTKKPFDRARVARALTPDAEEKKYAGKPYYETKRGGPGGGTALAFLGEHLLVVGPALGVQRVLDRKPAAASAGLKLAAGKPMLVAELHLAPFKEVLKTLPEAAKPFEPLLRARDGTLTIVGDADTKADLRFTFADENEAAEGAKAAKAALDLGRQGLAEARREMSRSKEQVLKSAEPAEMAKWLFEQAETTLGQADDALKEATVKQQGKELHVALHAKTPPGAAVTMLGGWLFLRVGAEAKSEPAKP